MSAQSSPLQPNKTILEDRWPHQVMIFFSSFDQRSSLFNFSLLALLFALYFGLAQWLAPPIAFPATIILVVFMLLDLALLWSLPRLDISYGPIASPFIVTSIPRWLVAGAGLLLALWQPTLALWFMGLLQLAGLLVYLWGMLIEPHQLALTTLNIEAPALPAAAKPVRLLHLSDLHLERLTRREAKVLALIDQVQPDLIVITGDYLNLSYTQNAEAIVTVREFLAKIKAPFGVYATLGSPPVDLATVAPHHFTNTDIQLLRHDTVDLDLGDNRFLTIMGSDCSHDMVYDRVQFANLFAQSNTEYTRVLLYHSPELMPAVQQHDVALFLCGHTHGGQVRMPLYGAIMTSACTGKQYEMGRYDENGTTLYVSRGIGLEGMCAPRIRLLCPPEITLVTLHGTG